MVSVGSEHENEPPAAISSGGGHLIRGRIRVRVRVRARVRARVRGWA